MNAETGLAGAPEVIDSFASALEALASLELAGDRTLLEAELARYPPAQAAELRKLLPIVSLLGSLRSQPERAGAGAPALPDDEHLGDYRLLRELGRGGMGIVYEAEQLSLRRRVALKLLPWTGLCDQRALARFRHEAQAAAALHHPHIVPIYQVGCERGIQYYVMRLIDGISLDKLLTGSDTPATGLFSSESEGIAVKLRRIAEIGVQAAEALHYAHEAGIVHRDVKPGNLLLDADGALWISDFGLARIEGEAGLTVTGEVLGTLRYMSPEQARGDRTAITGRSDVYSLAATLYELTTRQPVFAATDQAALLRDVAEREPVAPRRLLREMPPDLETILLTALAKEPGDRYPSAAALANDLRRFLADEPPLARRPGILRRSARWAKRHQKLVAATGCGALVVAGLLGAGIGWWWRDRAAQRALVASLRQEAVGAQRDLGIVLSDTGQPDEAVAAILRTIALEPDVAAHRYNLGRMVNQQGKLSEAKTHYRKALELDPGHFRAHGNLANLLQIEGKRDEAIAHFHLALAAEPSYVPAHFGLGNEFAADGQYEAAMASYRRALEFAPDGVHPRFNLGSVLLELGRFHEALEQFTAVETIVARDRIGGIPIAGAKEEASRMLEMEAQLPSYLEGTRVPAGAEECIDAANLCHYTRRHASAVRFFRAAFAADPAVADRGTNASYRFHAARDAVAALSGQGKEAVPQADHDALRAEAIAWLDAELERLRPQLAADDAEARSDAQRLLARWERDPVLAPLRDGATLSKLPPPQRAALRDLWQKAEALLEENR